MKSKNIIEQLYYGEISPCSQPTPDTPKYRETSKFIDDTEAAFVEKYPDCKEILEELVDAIHITAAMEGVADFEMGFELGVKFMIEVFSSEL